MVDPVGPRPVRPSDLVAAVTRASATPRSAQDLAGGIEEQGVPTLAHDLARRAPVDTGRVDALRRQIAEGSFRIDAAAIADRMLAAKAEWVANDPA